MDVSGVAKGFIYDDECTHVFEYQDVNLCKCRFDVDKFDSILFSSLEIDLPSEMQRAVDKRKAEFLAGRYAARQVLAKLGVVKQQVGVGARRCPVWPEHIVGSITHTGDVAICAVASDNAVSGLGIDLETVIDEKLAKTIKDSIICREEEALLRRVPISFDKAFSLVFSAKESLFKALYPNVGRYFDFSAARLSHLCTERGNFRLVLQESLSQEFRAGASVEGCFKFTDKQVFTAVVYCGSP